jgi:hypothetical protein
VSQFAAGCAVCGYDLEAARAAAAERGPSLAERASDLRPAGLSSPTFRQDAFLVAVIVALIVFFPIAGGALAAWTAYDRNRSGDSRIRNVALVLLAVAVALLLLPDLRFGILSAVS